MNRYLNFLVFSLFVGFVVASSALGQNTLVATGTIEGVSSSVITVSTVSFEIKADTKFIDKDGRTGTYASFGVGDLVEVKGTSSPSHIIAERVKAKKSKGSFGSSTSETEEISLRCEFPSLRMVRHGVAKRILEHLAAAGIKGAKVRVVPKISNRGSIIKAPTRDGSMGVVPQLMGPVLIGLSGSASTIPCEGVLKIKAVVETQSGVESTVTSEHPIQGYRVLRGF